MATPHLIEQCAREAAKQIIDEWGVEPVPLDYVELGALIVKHLAPLEAQLSQVLADNAVLYAALLNSHRCEEVIEGVWQYCDKPAQFCVQWSDRVQNVCAAHLENAKQHAANDNSHDRTDNPIIDPLHVPAALLTDHPGASLLAELASLRAVVEKQREAKKAVAARLADVCSRGGSMQDFLDAGSMRELVLADSASQTREGGQ